MATFSARARTLAMLGRQQIAGIPTAISELFKNAHDAYATTVEVDYYRSDGLLVLRDDGIGMEPDDFSRYWLTIGTDSKIDPPPARPRPPGFDSRPMLGEKGIGRLSIAAIGPQVLVMTRAWTRQGVSDLTVAFINWSVFEWPAVTLQDIEIPIRVITNGDLPTRNDVDHMVADFRQNGSRLRDRVASDHVSELNRQLSDFQVDPQEIDSYHPQLSLRGTGSGTHFVLLPTSSLLPEDIDEVPRTRTSRHGAATPLQKALFGFANTMTPDAPPPVVRTAFRDHQTDDYYDNLVSDSDFFSAEDFRNADHQFTGDFDNFGQFTGDIHIYGERIERHVIPWRNPGGRPTRCGPFRIGFAAVERREARSTLPPEEHIRMSHKLDKFGSLYIYRDGIRIQPYGDTTYDWLDIEYRRTKGAGYYYFSHRKMFGAVELTHQHNGALKEKAGREGFMENVAYREFKDILKSFLGQVAANFFRVDGIHADIHKERGLEITAMHRAEQRRMRQVRVQRQKLTTDLDAFFVAVAEDTPTAEVEAVATRLESELRQVESPQNSHERTVAVERLEAKAVARLREVEARYHVTRPRVSLTKTARADWERYRSKYIDLSSTVFDPARQLVASLVDDALGPSNTQRKARADTALENLSSEIVGRVRAECRTVTRKADTVLDDIRQEAKKCAATLLNDVQQIQAEFYRTDFSESSAAEFFEALAKTEAELMKLGDSARDILQRIELELDAIAASDGDSLVDQLVAVEQRNQTLEEQLAMDVQLAQLGMAVEIINHEFGSTVRTLRNNLRRLKGWADTNPELRVLYSNIRTSFDHLDGYLKMFTPLQRRLYRTRIDIKGTEIAIFLRDLFRVRLERHEIVLRCTKAFLGVTVQSFPSSFYPVFVNVVDNAIYWLSIGLQEQPRRIVLDADGDRLLVTDNGPGITTQDREHIFDFGYTRKPGGRGMGLHIARETLRQVGYKIGLMSTADDTETTFAVEPVHD